MLSFLQTFHQRYSFLFSLWDVPEAYRQSMPESEAKTRGSGLHCDCNVRWLKDWLAEKKLGDMTCATPPSLTGVMVSQLQARHFVCGTFEEQFYQGTKLAWGNETCSWLNLGVKTYNKQEILNMKRA